MPAEESLFVVIYPYKFTDFVYDLIELGEFKRYCDVLVWDISMITSPKYSKGVSVKRSKKDGVITFSSLLSFIRNVYELRERSTKLSICILNEVPCSSLSEVICNLIIGAFLRKRCVILDLYNGGVPINYYDGTLVLDGINGNSKFYAKFVRFCKNTTTILEAWKKMLGVLFGLLAHIIPSSTTHRLVAGEDWFKLANKSTLKGNRIRFVFAHSNDYSNNLLHKPKSPSLAIPQKRMAVLLDGGGPMYGSDFLHMRRKVYFTTDVWYPSLVRFFDWIEDQTGVQVKIAGHYKSTHVAIAPCFGNRPVHYGKTRELVRNSDFVITRASTAISYAVMFKKPVIFIYSNQLKDDYLAMSTIRGTAAMLGNEPINIDAPPIDIEGLLEIDEKRYRNYKRICLTSTSSPRPNSQIILEDIMNIDTGSDITKIGPDCTIK